MLSSRQPEPSQRPLVAVALTSLAAAGAIGWLMQRASKPRKDARHRAAQGLGAGAALLCISVALDSALEHYRGSFKDPVMFAGPAMALVGFGSAAFIAFRPERSNERLPKLAFVAVGATGMVGIGFHAFNILKRPGGLSPLNLFYAAPAGAPAAMVLAAIYGRLAARFLAGSGEVCTRTSRQAAAIMAVSIAGTAGEAGLLHFRGAFQNPAMYAPVTVPPLAAIMIGAAALSPRVTRLAEPLLKATAVLGIAGPFFHAYGIHRNMGGWHNWSQMILQGPPLPAPPAFLGIAIAGLGVLPGLEERR